MNLFLIISQLFPLYKIEVDSVHEWQLDLLLKLQICTQRYDRRPYGVGLLVAGWDEKGPHIYQTCPSANYYDCKAMAIGARSQSARTYLEKHLDQFKT